MIYLGWKVVYQARAGKRKEFWTVEGAGPYIRGKVLGRGKTLPYGGVQDGGTEDKVFGRCRAAGCGPNFSSGLALLGHLPPGGRHVMPHITFLRGGGNMEM